MNCHQQGMKCINGGTNDIAKHSFREFQEKVSVRYLTEMRHY
jgi:hypothetical protein